MTLVDVTVLDLLKFEVKSGQIFRVVNKQSKIDRKHYFELVSAQLLLCLRLFRFINFLS